MQKKWKRVLMVVWICLAVITGMLAFLEFSRRDVQTVTTEQFEYALTPQIDSIFRLIPNDIYPTNELPGTRLIINKLIEDMTTTFQLDVTGTPGMSSDLSIQHIMRLEGVYGEEEEVLFSKEDALYAARVSGPDRQHFTKSSTYDLDTYKRYLLNVYETTEVFASSDLQAVWQVSGSLKYQGQEFPIDHAFALQIPIGQEVLKLDTSTLEPLANTVETTEEIPVPKDYTLTYILAGCALTGLLLTGATLFLVRTKPEKSAYEREKDKTFNEYGARLAALHEPMTNQYARLIHVSTVEDLVKISDEIRQPVFYYEVDEEDVRKLEYYVFDDSRMYYLVRYDQMEISIEEFISENAT